MKKIGIYKITNKINNKVYIGQSKNISRRWREHKRHYKNKNNSSVLYKAIRKYGLENFLFEIIELCDESKLDELEIKYIANYKSNNKDYGYNLTEGGDSPPRLKNEDNPNSKLTVEDVYNIREQYNNHVNKHEVYDQYSDIITINTFNDVWLGKTWNNIHMGVYTDENKKFHAQNYDKIKAKNNIRTVTDEQILFVRDLYNKGEVSRQEAFTLSGIDNFYVFDDIWNNRTFTHIKSSIKNNHKKFKRIKGCQTGTKNNASKLTDDKVDLIKEQKL